MSTPATYEFQRNGLLIIQLHYQYDGNSYGMPKVIEGLMKDPCFVSVLSSKLIALSRDMSVIEREDMSRKFASWLTSVVRPLYPTSDKGFEYVTNHPHQYIWNLVPWDLIPKKNGDLPLAP